MKYAFRIALLILALSRGLVAATVPEKMKEAQAAFGEKKFDRVVALLSPHLDAIDRSSFLILAKSYIQQDNAFLAAKTLLAAKPRFPNDAEIATALGGAQFAVGRDREAKATLREVIETNPKYEDAYLVLGEHYEKRSNWAEIRFLYQDLIKLVGERPLYLTKLCTVTTKRAIYDEAFLYCEKAIRMNPKEPSNYLHLASANQHTGKTSEADRNFRRAADSFAKSEPAQLEYAKFLKEQKKAIEAFGYFKKATVANEKSLEAWKGVASLGIEIQKFAEAQTAIQKICQLDDSEGVRQAKRARDAVRSVKQRAWEEKFENLVNKCGSNLEF